MKFFVSNINWTALWFVAAIAALVWAGLAKLPVLFPAFAPYYEVISGLLAGIQAAFLFAARGGKFVKNRQEPPQGGQV